MRTPGGYERIFCKDHLTEIHLQRYEKERKERTS